jgi:hypothetical protein
MSRRKVVDLPPRTAATAPVLGGAVLLEAKTKDALGEAWAAAVIRELELKVELSRATRERRALTRRINRLSELRSATDAKVGRSCA